jgi:hypothetical protein
MGMLNRDRRVVLAAGVAGAAFTLVGAVLFDTEQGVFYLGGFAGGAVAGWYSGRYGPAMKNGLQAGVLGVFLAAAAATLYGVALSVSMGFGVDSLVSFYYSALGVLGVLLLVPLFAMEGVFGSIAANELRLRVGGT